MSKPKLYLFAVGGTGSRVLKSLVMLLASGIKANTEKIIPMIIDTDINNGDMEKCRNMIKKYNRIHDSTYKGIPVDQDLGQFFRTPIATPKEMNVSGNDYGTLQDMLQYNSLGARGFKKTKGLFDLLYNESNKKMPLEKGFLGNPNVGSVVLKHVVESQQFREFTQDFRQEDRIFVISSIFGGTGAAGFPLLMNVFRNPQSGMNNSNFINNAIIGGTSVLPYFQVDVEKFNNNESAINSSTFITKTKAALQYYNRNLSPLLNSLFYVGDTRHSNYDNCDGGTEQKNPANFIELTAAMSILEFLDYEPAATTKNDLNQPTRFFEYGIESDAATLTLEHLKSNSYLKKLLNFHYFNTYVTNFMESSLQSRTMAWRRELKIPSNFEKQPYFKDLKSFSRQCYYRWLIELNSDNHNRKFLPFNLSYITNANELKKDTEGTLPAQVRINKKDLHTLVTGVPATKQKALFKNPMSFDETFSNLAKSIKKEQLGSTERSVGKMLSNGIETIINQHFTLQ